jgi:hypothetical protein
MQTTTSVRTSGRSETALAGVISFVVGSPNATPNEVLQPNGIELPVTDQMKFYNNCLRHPLAIPPRDRHRAHNPAGYRHSRTGHGGCVAQRPIEGVSMAYTFDKAKANAPFPHRTQYFEMLGVQGLYDDGWMLDVVPIRPPWELLGTAMPDPASAFKFELYDVLHQCTDVATQNPAKVQEMKCLIFVEFARYQVLPLDASVATRMITPRPECVEWTQGVHLLPVSSAITQRPPMTGVRGAGLAPCGSIERRYLPNRQARRVGRNVTGKSSFADDGSG